MSDPNREPPRLSEEVKPHSPFDYAAKIVLVLLGGGVVLTVLAFGTCLLLIR